MEPEISRRCLTCGASVRGTAFFCPECGTPIKGATQPLSASSVGETASSRVVEVHPTAPVAEAESADTVGPAKQHRIRSATREAVEGKIAPRVEKLRHASNVVLEEASDDPNLRFVLVAIVIFVLALLFLWLNQVLG